MSTVTPVRFCLIGLALQDHFTHVEPRLSYKLGDKGIRENSWQFSIKTWPNGGFTNTATTVTLLTTVMGLSSVKKIFSVKDFFLAVF